MPPATLDAFRDHGRVRASLEEDLEVAHDIMEVLAHVGISMPEVTEKLLEEGVRLFAEPFDKLLDALAYRGV
jgi:transaldolase